MKLFFFGVSFKRLSFDLYSFRKDSLIFYCWKLIKLGFNAENDFLITFYDFYEEDIAL